MPDANLCRVGRASSYPKMGMNLGGSIMYSLGVSKSDTVGNPVPSMLMQYPATFKFRWAAESGARTVQVDVKQSCNVSPRPTLTVKANPDAGISFDVVGSAPSSTGWVTIGPLNLTPTSNSVLIIELSCNQRQEGDDGCFWDNLTTG